MAKSSIGSIGNVDSSCSGRPTLDQLVVLTAVVETGSFSAAARRLRRAQSVVSYGIANLETQLGLQLFVRGQRRPVLTEAGRAILADARRVTRDVEDLRARAAALAGGLEAEVGLVVDVLFPIERLVGVLDAFASAFPTVALRLHAEALGAVVQLVLERRCALGIAGWVAVLHDGLERHRLGEVRLITVAAPGHPLCALPAPLPAAALRDETQLVLSDRSKLTEGQDFGVFSARCWRLGDLGAKHALLRAGLGWGNMPEPMVAADLAAGRLVRLVIEGQQDGLAMQTLLVSRADRPLGPAARWLAGRLQAEAPFEAPAIAPDQPAPRLHPAPRLPRQITPKRVQALGK